MKTRNTTKALEASLLPRKARQSPKKLTGRRGEGDERDGGEQRVAPKFTDTEIVALKALGPDLLMKAGWSEALFSSGEEEEDEDNEVELESVATLQSKKKRGKTLGRGKKKVEALFSRGDEEEDEEDEVELESGATLQSKRRGKTLGSGKKKAEALFLRGEEEEDEEDEVEDEVELESVVTLQSKKKRGKTQGREKKKVVQCGGEGEKTVSKRGERKGTSQRRPANKDPLEGLLEEEEEEEGVTEVVPRKKARPQTKKGSEEDEEESNCVKMLLNKFVVPRASKERTEQASASESSDEEPLVTGPSSRYHTTGQSKPPKSEKMEILRVDRMELLERFLKWEKAQEPPQVPWIDVKPKKGRKSRKMSHDKLSTSRSDAWKDSDLSGSSSDSSDSESIGERDTLPKPKLSYSEVLTLSPSRMEAKLRSEDRSLTSYMPRHVRAQYEERKHDDRKRRKKNEEKARKARKEEMRRLLEKEKRAEEKEEKRKAKKRKRRNRQRSRSRKSNSDDSSSNSSSNEDEGSKYESTRAGARDKDRAEHSFVTPFEASLMETNLQMLKAQRELNQITAEKAPDKSSLPSESKFAIAFRCMMQGLRLCSEDGLQYASAAGFSKHVCLTFNDHHRNFQRHGIQWRVTPAVIELVCSGKLTVVGLGEFTPWTSDEALAAADDTQDPLRLPLAKQTRKTLPPETFTSWDQVSRCVKNFIKWISLLFGSSTVKGFEVLHDFMEAHCVQSLSVLPADVLSLWYASMKEIEHKASRNLEEVSQRGEEVGQRVTGTPQAIANAFLRIGTSVERVDGKKEMFLKPLMATLVEGEHGEGGVLRRWVERRNERVVAFQAQVSSGRLLPVGIMPTKHDKEVKIKPGGKGEKEKKKIAKDATPKKPVVTVSFDDEASELTSLVTKAIYNRESQKVRQVALTPRPICYRYCSNDGCSLDNCSFDHFEMTKEQVNQVKSSLDILTARYGGRKGQPPLTVAALREAIKESKKDAAEPSSRAHGMGTVVPSDLMALRSPSRFSYSHPLQQEAIDVACAEQLGSRPISLNERRRRGKLLLPSPNKDDPVRIHSLNTLTTLKTIFPECVLWPTDVLSYVVQLVVEELKRRKISMKMAPVALPSAASGWMRSVAASLNKSKLEGTDEASLIFKSTTPLQLVARYRQDRVGFQAAIFVEDSEPGEVVTMRLFGEDYLVRDGGETIRYPNGQLRQRMCVVVSLALCLGVKASDLLDKLIGEAEKGSNMGSSKLDIVDVKMRLLAHELKCPSSPAQDAHLVRFLPGGGLLLTLRVVLILAPDNGGKVEVQELRSEFFDENKPGCKTVFLLIIRDHCRIVTGIPSRFGHMKKNFEVPNLAVKSFLRWIASKRCEPMRLVHPCLKSLHEERTIDVECLDSCNECGQSNGLGSLTYAGRKDTSSAKGIYTSSSTLLDSWGTADEKIETLTSSQEMSKDEVYNTGISVPAKILEYCAATMIGGGLNKEVLTALGKNRDQTYQETVALSVEDIASMKFKEGAVEEAESILLEARKVGLWADKAVLRAKEKVTEQRMENAVKVIRDKCDGLVSKAGGLRAAMLALRHAKLMDPGGMCLNSSRIEKLRGLMPDAMLEIVKQIADYGVPLLQPMPFPLQLDPIQRPYDTAHDVRLEVFGSTLKDMAAGNALLLSSEVANVEDYGGGRHPVGSTKKADGTARTINDARVLNEFLALLAEQEELDGVGGIKGPPAVCGRLRDVVREIVRYIVLYPGIWIYLEKFDIDNAFKRMHMNTAEATSIVALMPELSKEMPDTVALSATCVFGLTFSPGWFGLPAWGLTAAISNTAPDEPEINGTETYEASIHVDDTVLVLPGIGQAPWIIGEWYTAFAEVMFGSGAVNSKKKDLEGYPQQRLSVWGYIIDLTGVKEGGLMAATLSMSEDRLMRLHNYLSDELLGCARRKKMKLKELQHIQGVTCWISVASRSVGLVLNAVTPMEAGMKPKQEWVAPTGTAESVEVLWEQFREALLLLKVVCKDLAAFDTPITSSLVRSMSLSEQIALGVPRGYIISDATGGRENSVMAAVDYTTGTYSAHKTWPYISRLMARLKIKPTALALVAWQELLPIAALAMEHGPKWGGMLIVSVVDNSIAVQALQRGVSHDPIIRWLMGVILRCQIRYGFEMWGMWIASSNNLLADMTSRKAYKVDDEVLAQLVEDHTPGLTRTDMTKLLVHLEREMCQPGYTLWKKDEEEEEEPTTYAGARKPRRSSRGILASGEFEMLRALLIHNSITTSSRSTYSSSQKHWIEFTSNQGLPPILSEEDADDVVVDFIVDRGLVHGYAPTTVHVMLMAMRKLHVDNGHGDPLKGKLLIKAAMQGLRNIHGGVIRKVPVTTKMLRRAARRLDQDKWDELMLLTAMVFMFLLLLRSSEVLRKGEAPHPKHCVRMRMLTFLRKGKVVKGKRIQEADALSVLLAYSKADQNGQGSELSVSAAPGNKLCLLKLLKKAHMMNPSAFEEGDRFVFTLKSGRVLHRDVVTGALREAALEIGVPSRAISVHSLRSGGASALWDAGFSAEEIKRKGRWSSDCWKMYVWNGKRRHDDAADRMLGSSVSVSASLAYFKRHAAARP